MNEGRRAGAFPRLVADIGGTNARFGLVRARGAAVTDIVVVRCADFVTIVDAVRHYLDALPPPRPEPCCAAFAIAAVVAGDQVRLTNGDWTFSRREVETALGLAHLQILNDFEALALALPQLRAGDCTPLGGTAPSGRLAMALVGSGTGLGVAAVVPTPTGWTVVPGEGGHASVAPTDAAEDEILRHAWREFEHVSAERLLSGTGLPVLHRAVAAVHGEAAPTLSPADITARGLAGDRLCRATLDAFCALLGSFAGNVALTFGARGGVFIGGGIVPRISDFVAASRFRERFEAKGRFRAYLAAIPTAIIMTPHETLNGAARAIEGMLEAIAQGHPLPGAIAGNIQ